MRDGRRMQQVVQVLLYSNSPALENVSVNHKRFTARVKNEKTRLEKVLGFLKKDLIKAIHKGSEDKTKNSNMKGRA